MSLLDIEIAIYDESHEIFPFDTEICDVTIMNKKLSEIQISEVRKIFKNNKIIRLGSKIFPERNLFSSTVKKKQ